MFKNCSAKRKEEYEPKFMLETLKVGGWQNCSVIEHGNSLSEIRDVQCRVREQGILGQTCGRAAFAYKWVGKPMHAPMPNHLDSSAMLTCRQSVVRGRNPCIRFVD